MTTIVDGKDLARECIARMRTFVATLNRVPHMTAFTMNPTAPTRQFLKLKQRVADQIGVVMHIEELAADTTVAEACLMLDAAIAETDGVVIQLPFVEGFDVDTLLARLPEDLDPDCMGVEAGELLRGHEHIVLPPVVSAIRHIAVRHGVSFAGKKVAVVGQGRLVGAPAAQWCEEIGAQVARLTKSSPDLTERIAEADVVVLGAGSPGLLTARMVREGVAIFDAGTSEEGGRVVGDADASCGEKASLITPVPGGIGPLAVAELFGNLLRLRFDYQGRV